jgi:hypothetical protein
MSHSPQSAFQQATSAQRSHATPRSKEDIVYQAVTVAAIMSLLASVWVF